MLSLTQPNLPTWVSHVNRRYLFDDHETFQLDAQLGYVPSRHLYVPGTFSIPPESTFVLGFSYFEFARTLTYSIKRP